ncbi:hypothetical protein [Streptomyces rimosus]|uniref:hypothetical protein n=1 Tax=Streptomyces rimosus TaxID=1927 RepID=UPI0004C0B5C6|nr:hypothetical protein [Streptomyces rimosus]
MPSENYWEWPSSIVGRVQACRPCAEERDWPAIAAVDAWGPSERIPKEAEHGLTVFCWYCLAVLDHV